MIEDSAPAASLQCNNISERGHKLYAPDFPTRKPGAVWSGDKRITTRKPTTS